MILCPPGWHEWRAGDVLMLSPRVDRVHTVITYAERAVPVRSFPAVVQAVVADDSEFIETGRRHVQRMITNEGEYAASIVVTGTYRGQPIAHVIACIYTEMFHTLLAARTEADYLDETERLVLDLVREDRLSLGVRRRRVGFVPPKGWHPVPGIDLEMVLLPPEYPKIHGSITMYAAEPAGFDAYGYQKTHDARVGLPAPLDESHIEITVPNKTAQPLRGSEWSTVRELPGGGKMIRRFAVLRDERYVYATKLEALDHDGVQHLHDAFLDTLATIEPIPHAHKGDALRDSSVFEIWND